MMVTEWSKIRRGGAVSEWGVCVGELNGEWVGGWVSEGMGWTSRPALPLERRRSRRA